MEKLVTKYHKYWNLLDVEQHSQFENRLNELIFKPKERNVFYDKLLEVNSDVTIDTFKEYFELYSAERKTNQQDFTPESIAQVMSEIVEGDKGADNYSAYDSAAGTGTLIINKWNNDRMKVHPFDYYPHNYFYMCEELSDTAVIYLLHNLTLRGMNAIVMHGDSIERKYKQVYFIQNSHDDHMKYSDINLMPHSECLERVLDVRKWTQKSINHKESQKVVWHGLNVKKENDEQMTLFKE